MALDYTIIGERLKKARLDKNLTQEQLAKKLNTTQPNISRLHSRAIKKIKKYIVESGD